MNTMADGAAQRLVAQIGEALFGQPGLTLIELAEKVKGMRASESDTADSRVRFDAWLEINSVDTTRWGDGAYTDPVADGYWRAWQAALSAQREQG